MNYFGIFSRVLFFILFFTSCSKSPEQHSMIISGIEIVDVINGSIISNQTILINADTITKIVSETESSFHRSDITIDGRNKYLMPGLWDLHVHFRGGPPLVEENKKLLPLYIINGVTCVRDAGGDLTSSILEWRDEINRGATISPSIFTSGPKLDGPNPTWQGSLEVTNEADIQAAIDSLESLGVDYIKIYDSRITRKAYLQILEEAKRRNIKTSGHMPFTVLLEEALNRDIHSIEHLYYVLKGCSAREKEITENIRNGTFGFWGSMNELIASYDSAVAEKTFASMINHDTYSVPTLHIGHVLSYLDQDSHKDDDYLNFIGPGIRNTYTGRVKRAMSASPQAIESRHNLHQTFRRLVKSMHEAGVQILSGSDAGAYNSYVYPGISIHKELEILVACGLNPGEAIKTATINGATFMGKEEKFGSVEPGKYADLLILKSNPLSDIRATRSIEYVILKGKPFHMSELENLLNGLKNSD